MPDNYELEIEHGTGELGPSRSSKKRGSAALQKLGEALAALAPRQLTDFALPDGLIAAILDLQTIRKHEARRRQMQYIGRLMRDLDEETVRHLSSSLDNLNKQRLEDAESFHALETLRDELAASSDAEQAIKQAVASTPGFEDMFTPAQLNKLRHLVDAAQSEKRSGKNRKWNRELFRFLKEILSGQDN